MIKINKKISFKTKQQLRDHMVPLIKRQRKEARLEKSQAISKKLFNLPAFKQALVVLFYASVRGEVGTSEMITQARKLGKKIALPKVNLRRKSMKAYLISDFRRDLAPGAYGIKEPRAGRALSLSPKKIDMVIVPGIAFDRDNHRLGRGAGYYDRFLHKLPKAIPTVGLAFDFQRVSKIPQLQKHDVALTHVISN